MPLDRVRDILKIAQEPVSLETPIGEEEDHRRLPSWDDDAPETGGGCLHAAWLSSPLRCSRR